MKNCPLCNEKLYSGIGAGCKMCGMPLNDKNKLFCSNSCKRKYKGVNLLNNWRKNDKKN